MFFALCIFFSFALIRIEGQNAADTKIAAAASDEPLTCTEAGSQCGDCSTLLFCFGNNTLPVSLPCPSEYPYCANGTCTLEPDVSCTVSPEFVCTSDGIFPDPSDCTRYRLCASEESMIFQCPSGFVFNSQNHFCQMGTQPCAKIDCSNATLNSFVAYASSSNYYAYCLFSGIGIQTLMFKCKQDEIFDPTINACRFYCKASGNFQNPADCNQYFYCSRVDAKPSEPLSCPPKYVFDGRGCNRDATECQNPPTAATATVVK
ncbi:uncharacterized protein LOC119083858 [Bradysia coprophila]|uniref:uncharacterized protein LOC119083858 n=1 Tax=Bradysia coprophila TaxID=38358 RepID=UPI00187D7691|nr:uncharacterized protein LOC119083858 [Bradysia coprophila]